MRMQHFLGVEGVSPAAFTAMLGLPAARTEMADFGGKRVLVVEWLDRRWTGDHRLLRLPQEDGCRALSIPRAAKYPAQGGPGI
jgi:serine/threonine-protein kinase HipA